jgi:hypothetical protein
MTLMDIVTLLSVGASILGVAFSFGRQSQKLQQISQDVNQIAQSFRHLDNLVDKRLDRITERLVRVETKIESGRHHTTLDEME